MGSAIGEGTLAPIYKGPMEGPQSQAPAPAQVGGEKERKMQWGRGTGPFSFFLNWKYQLRPFFKACLGENQLLWESSDCNEVRGQTPVWAPTPRRAEAH